jgi:hypothetical protein
MSSAEGFTGTNGARIAGRPRLNYVALGEIMLAEAGAEACAAGYGTTDPEWIGRYAIEYGDITPQGELN